MLVGETFCISGFFLQTNEQLHPPLASQKPCLQSFTGRFSKAPESFRVRKAIVRKSLSANRVVYTSETSSLKRTSVHVNETAQ